MIQYSVKQIKKHFSRGRRFLVRHRYKIILLSFLITFLLPDYIREHDLTKYQANLSTLMLIASSLLIVIKSNKLLGYLGIIVMFIFSLYLLDSFIDKGYVLRLIKTLTLLAFFTIMFYELIIQIVKERNINFDFILGTFTGFILLGYIGYACLYCVEILHPGSFKFAYYEIKANELLYYSFSTLTTTGFGDIIAVSGWARRCSMFLAIIGEFYMSVVMAIVISMYINNFNQKRKAAEKSAALNNQKPNEKSSSIS